MTSKTLAANAMSAMSFSALLSRVLLSLSVQKCIYVNTKTIYVYIEKYILIFYTCVSVSVCSCFFE